MRDRLLTELQSNLADLENQRLRRSLRPVTVCGRMIHTSDGRQLINLSGNDYLALASHPKLKQAAINAIATYGAGAGASRLVTGTFDIHMQVEQAFAAFKSAEAALLLPTGYMANLAVLTALAGPGDLVCVDKLNHASLIDAARASGAEVRSFPHLETAKLDRLLARHAGRKAKADTGRAARRFVVTDAVFSMDGDVANLPALCDLAQRYEAILVVDEAHATGVLGDGGQGLCHEMGIAHRAGVVLITVSTASKALGGLGGIVTGPRVIIETLVNRSRSAIYTTAMPAGQAAAIGAAIEVIRDEPQRRQRLGELSHHMRRELAAMGWRLPQVGMTGDAGSGSGGGGGEERATPILPLVVGDAADAIALAGYLESHSFAAVAIRPPTVSPGAARVRISLRCDLEDADVDRFLQVLHGWAG